jgi:hypothetical protein
LDTKNFLKEHELKLTAEDALKEVYGEDLNDRIMMLENLSEGKYDYEKIIREYGYLDMRNCLNMIIIKRKIYETLLKKS